MWRPSDPRRGRPNRGWLQVMQVMQVMISTHLNFTRGFWSLRKRQLQVMQVMQVMFSTSRARTRAGIG